MQTKAGAVGAIILLAIAFVWIAATSEADKVAPEPLAPVRNDPARIAWLEKRMTTDFESLLAKLHEAGVELERAPSRMQEMFVRNEIALKGPTLASLGAATEILGAQPMLRSDTTLFVTTSGSWTWDAVVYSIFTGVPHQQKPLEEAYGRIAPQMIDFTPLIRLGFTQKDRLLELGEITIDNNDRSVWLAGRPASAIRDYPVDPYWTFLDQKENGRLVTRWQWKGLAKTSSVAP